MFDLTNIPVAICQFLETSGAIRLDSQYDGWPNTFRYQYMAADPQTLVDKLIPYMSSIGFVSDPIVDERHDVREGSLIVTFHKPGARRNHNGLSFPYVPDELHEVRVKFADLQGVP
jgi:hypothetical protein